MTFKELGLCAPHFTALDEQGDEKPSPIQEKAIPPALEGRDVLGCAQTGTGKTCAFAAPILQRLSAAGRTDHPIRALILTPTRELAIQIDESFQAYGKYLSLRHAVIFGGVSQVPQVARLQEGVDILVATPGRLADLHQQGYIHLEQLEIFVLDEADRMLDMGFIHDVKKILKWLPAKKQTLFFSATMPPEITELVNSLLHHPVRVAVNPVSSTVEVIDQWVYFVDKGNKTSLLAYLIGHLQVTSALVFTRTKHGANKVARDLTKAGIPAAAIHGNKSQTARQQALADFKAGRIRCLVATDIAARGLDIDGLSHVFNYNLPEVPETYVHRIGRTGRAGRGGTAISLCDFGEKPLLRDIEKLIKRTVTVVEDHPYPMVVLEAPKRDKNGRVINQEDAEARAAAKELRRVREEAARQRREEAARKAEEAALRQTEEEPAPPAEQEKKRSRRRRRKNKGAQDARQEAPVMEATETWVEVPQEQIPAPRRKLTRPGTRLDTGDAMPRTEFDRPDPLAGEHIMDATARLLAPRKGLVARLFGEERSAGRKGKKENKSRQQAAGTPAPEEKERQPRQEEQAKPSAPRHSRKGHAKKEERGRSGQAQENRPAQQRQAKGGTGFARPDRRKNRGGPRPPMEPMKSGRTKDSTEQKSLMKPYYLDD